MIILDVFLRQRAPLQEENASSEEVGAYRKTSLRQIAQLRGANAGRRRGMAGSCTSAKPRWSEVMIILCDFLRQGSPSQEENK